MQSDATHALLRVALKTLGLQVLSLVMESSCTRLTVSSEVAGHRFWNSPLSEVFSSLLVTMYQLHLAYVRPLASG